MEVSYSDAVMKIYASLVKKGKKTLDEIPEEYREAVKEYLGL